MIKLEAFCATFHSPFSLSFYLLSQFAFTVRFHSVFCPLCLLLLIVGLSGIVVTFSVCFLSVSCPLCLHFSLLGIAEVEEEMGAVSELHLLEDGLPFATCCKVSRICDAYVTNLPHFANGVQRPAAKPWPSLRPAFWDDVACDSDTTVSSHSRMHGQIRSRRGGAFQHNQISWCQEDGLGLLFIIMCVFSTT